MQIRLSQMKLCLPIPDEILPVRSVFYTLKYASNGKRNDTGVLRISHHRVSLSCEHNNNIIEYKATISIQLRFDNLPQSSNPHI